MEGKLWTRLPLAVGLTIYLFGRGKRCTLMSNSTHRGRCGKQMNTNNLLAEANQPIIVRWARTNPLEINGRTHWKLSVRQSQWGQMQHWAAFVNLNARPNKHNGGPLRSQPSLRVSAKWSTRSSKDIGGPLSSLPSYIDTHYAYSTSSNGQHWAASVIWTLPK